jgi:hypothetical protein
MLLIKSIPENITEVMGYNSLEPSQFTAGTSNALL